MHQHAKLCFLLLCKMSYKILRIYRKFSFERRRKIICRSADVSMVIFFLRHICKNQKKSAFPSLIRYFKEKKSDTYLYQYHIINKLKRICIYTYSFLAPKIYPIITSIEKGDIN